ncbi:hypothetical protein B0H14DRAFT_3853697 [Mycena olivaceomarginata]|nr:hypothetical protein B0H14DRAFT_3853697 [Mycena olivaceomarginata]
MFSTSGSIDEIHHARPFISAWATRLVAAQARKQADRATRDDPDNPDSRTRFVARTNGRKAGAHVVTWSQLLANFNLNSIHTKYSTSEGRLPASRAQNDLASDIYTKAPLDDIPAESPSLVSQLQQVHGLTKKKVYDTKPARIPFIMERVRDPYRKAPSQSPSISLVPETSSPPSLTRGSRSQSNLKPDRAFSSRLQRIGDSPGHSPYSSSTRSSPSSPVAQMPAAEGYPYALSAPRNVHSTLPADLDLAWTARADDVGFPYVVFPPGCEGVAGDLREITSTSPAFSTIPALDSPSYPIAHRFPTTADFGGFHQYHDEQAGFAAPPSQTTTHIYAPAPCLALPAAQMNDFLFASAAGAGASPMQMHTLPLPPLPILPPIAPHAFQDLTRFRKLERRHRTRCIHIQTLLLAPHAWPWLRLRHHEMLRSRLPLP